MFILGNFLMALGKILGMVTTIYIWLIIIRALISWVNPDPFNPIVVFLRRSTDPILEPLRRRIPPLGGLDFTPFIAIILLMFVKFFLVQSLIDLGWRLKHG
ncbi:MAG TPA: YggT family protein [bacterium]|nr:YggT family protein [bacterium]HEX67625.1 YggT family protein [bacterium]